MALYAFFGYSENFMIRIGFTQVTNSIDVHWWPSLAFGSIKAYLYKHLGDNVSIDRVPAQDLYKYDIAAISSTSQNYNIAMQIAYYVKQKNPKIITIIGGSHITWLPQTLIKEFDFGVMGEGEQTFLEFVQHVMRQGSVEDLFKINGLVLHGDDYLINTPQRELIEPLDKIPFAFREPAPAPHLFTSSRMSI